MALPMACTTCELLCALFEKTGVLSRRPGRWRRASSRPTSAVLAQRRDPRRHLSGASSRGVVNPRRAYAAPRRPGGCCSTATMGWGQWWVGTPWRGIRRAEQSGTAWVASGTATISGPQRGMQCRPTGGMPRIP